ncbi:fatty acid desaturase [Hoeflea marina]|uniref:Fatty acid desaturase n=1 Tax=Hoeflea marina TaxID=274592 RepID=A0A317PIP6_9HYPH|nr:fatty acid desaturase [Hoeflea marina]
MRDNAEWRTLLLAGVCYAVWLALTFGLRDLPFAAQVLLLIPVITLHSSLQHEVLHGHPFRNQMLNDLMMTPPIGILVPYQRFKACHLAHHINETITDPYDDPESYYLDPEVWNRKSAWLKALLTLNNTLVGRVTLGPALATIGFARAEWSKIRAGDRQLGGIWVRHLAGVSLILVLISRFGSLSAAGYFMAAYFGMGLLMVRSFLEHQAVDKTNARSVIIETRGPLAMLFLNNNLHSVHHAYPSLAWYRLPAFFQLNRDRFMRMNGGYRFRSYFEVFRRYALTPKEPVAWPLDRARLRRRRDQP